MQTHSPRRPCAEEERPERLPVPAHSRLQAVPRSSAAFARQTCACVLCDSQGCVNVIFNESTESDYFRLAGVVASAEQLMREYEQSLKKRDRLPWSKPGRSAMNTLVSSFSRLTEFAASTTNFMTKSLTVCL